MTWDANGSPVPYLEDLRDEQSKAAVLQSKLDAAENLLVKYRLRLASDRRGQGKRRFHCPHCNNELRIIVGGRP